MASRIDAVASRLETAIRMQQVSKTMSQTVAGMSNAMKSMDVEKISYTMEEFEKQFADMDVKSGYMEGAMEASTSMSTPRTRWTSSSKWLRMKQAWMLQWL